MSILPNICNKILIDSLDIFLSRFEELLLFYLMELLESSALLAQATLPALFRIATMETVLALSE